MKKEEAKSEMPKKLEKIEQESKKGVGIKKHEKRQ